MRTIGEAFQNNRVVSTAPRSFRYLAKIQKYALEQCLLDLRTTCLAVVKCCLEWVLHLLVKFTVRCLISDPENRRSIVTHARDTSDGFVSNGFLSLWVNKHCADSSSSLVEGHGISAYYKLKLHIITIDNVSKATVSLPKSSKSHPYARTYQPLNDGQRDPVRLLPEHFANY